MSKGDTSEFKTPRARTDLCLAVRGAHPGSLKSLRRLQMIEERRNDHQGCQNGHVFHSRRKNEQHGGLERNLSIAVVPCYWHAALCGPAGGRWHHGRLTDVSSFHCLLLRDWSSPES